MSELQKLISLEQDARNFGFDWPDVEMILGQVRSECQEVREAIANNEGSSRIQEEIGDLISSVISLCLFAGFDVDKTLAKVNEKFGSRMESIKRLAKERGFDNLQGQSIEMMLELWQEAKALEKSVELT
jgi:uncharacterized protein YabN with tetrapyrrole methylase and pyrophosphatase domain